MQASSCFGVIVVEPADSYPFEFDEDRIVALSDFWHASNDAIEAGLVNSTVFALKMLLTVVCVSG